MYSNNKYVCINKLFLSYVFNLDLLLYECFISSKS